MECVSILILVDIGLVHPLYGVESSSRYYGLNPYSCGYRTGTDINVMLDVQRNVSILILVDIGLVHLRIH